MNLRSKLARTLKPQRRGDAPTGREISTVSCYGEAVKILVPILALALVAGGVAAAEDPPAPRLIFKGENVHGEVWANVGLTIQRLDEDYVPLVVMIANHDREPVLIDRDALRLIGPNGQRYPMPTLKELRKNYRKTGIDARAVSGAGIPYEVWRQNRRLLESNFFPNTLTDRRALVVDEVTLPTGYALIDLVYFARPKGLERGASFILEVQALEWSGPVRVGISLN